VRHLRLVELVLEDHVLLVRRLQVLLQLFVLSPGLVQLGLELIHLLCRLALRGGSHQCFKLDAGE
jgi:hypothetical protein